MLHYNPQHVLSSTLFIFRRTNCIITASGIVTLCKQPYSMSVERLVNRGQKWSKGHAWIERMGEMSGTFVIISPRVFFPWLQYTSTTVLALHDQQFCVSSICWDFM